jgi:hypothetical protein
MKLKLLAMLACGCLLLSLVACGESSSSSGSSSDDDASGLLNDTGQDQFSDGSDLYDAEPDEYPGQDAWYGRDADAAAGDLTKIGGGSAGFDFTKLDDEGNDLDASATDWSCVRDNHTGMVWEVKLDDDSSVRDMEQIFIKTGDSGISYISVISELISELNDYNGGVGLCGYSDWQVPELEELRSIVDYGTSSPSIDIDYFPYTQSSFYWADEVTATSADEAWGLFFYRGDDSYGGVSSAPAYARLVHIEVGTEADFTDSGDGTISDAATGLTWKKCSEGQTWDSSDNSCTGTIDTYTWQQALQSAVSVNAGSGENLGWDDWRLPNIKELHSIVDLTSSDPAIDSEFFPDTGDGNDYWTSTPSAILSGCAWGVRFSPGDTFYNYIASSYSVRLVRAGL